ncbi:MAG: EAL domain-containing protein [Solirubrobacteraceae bacterium]
MDDFGTGYSELSYLQQLPMDILKIDKACIDRIGQHADEERLLNGIIKLAHDVNLSTVAEGVETPEQAQALLRLDAELGQGFHFARPASAGVIDGLISPATPPAPSLASTTPAASPA